MSPLLLVWPGSRARSGSLHRGGPLRVFVAASDGLDLVQGQNSSRRKLSVVVQPRPADQGGLLGHHRGTATAMLVWGIHVWWSPTLAVSRDLACI